MTALGYILTRPGLELNKMSVFRFMSHWINKAFKT